MSEQQQTTVRVHISVPGPRAGVPYGLSIETVNAGDMWGYEIQDEVRAAVAAYDEAKKQMDKRLATKPDDKDYTPLLEASVERAKRGEA